MEGRDSSLCVHAECERKKDRTRWERRRLWTPRGGDSKVQCGDACVAMGRGAHTHHAVWTDCLNFSIVAVPWMLLLLVICMTIWMVGSGGEVKGERYVLLVSFRRRAGMTRNTDKTC
jgi:hypothetical protein